MKQRKPFPQFRANGRRTLLSRYHDSLFGMLYNYRNEYSTGRACILWSNFLSSVCNTFISGAFYTAFLLENGIDIVQVGILGFLPSITTFLSLLTPKLYSRIKKRRGLLLFSNLFYYICVVFATTLMPRFVTGSSARTLWFAVLLLLGNAVNALLSGGSSAWHIKFLPKPDDQRSFHLSMTYLVFNASSAITALVASFTAQALEGSAMQGQIISILRYISFALAAINVLQLYLIPKEYPYDITPGQKLRDVFTRPLRNRKFVCTGIIAILWQFVTSLNWNTFSYHLLDTLKMDYALTYTNTIVCVVCSFFLVPLWRGMVRRYGWFKVMASNCFLNIAVEFLWGSATVNSIWLYVLGGVVSGINLCGAQQALAQMFYINLPKKDIDLYNTCNSFVNSMFFAVGGMIGTWLLAVLAGEGGMTHIAGLALYPSQVICYIKVVLFGLLGVYTLLAEPHLQPDADATA